MSRIGNKPVPVIDGVNVSVAGGTINVEGPKGKLSYAHRPEVSIEVDEEAKVVKVSRSSGRQEFACFSWPDSSVGQQHDPGS